MVEVCLVAKAGFRIYLEERDRNGRVRLPDTAGVPEGCGFIYGYRKNIPVSVLREAIPWTLPGWTEPVRLSANHPLFVDWSYVMDSHEDPRLDEVIARLTAA